VRPAGQQSHTGACAPETPPRAARRSAARGAGSALRRGRAAQARRASAPRRASGPGLTRTQEPWRHKQQSMSRCAGRGCPVAQDGVLAGEAAAGAPMSVPTRSRVYSYARRTSTTPSPPREPFTWPPGRARPLGCMRRAAGGPPACQGSMRAPLTAGQDRGVKTCLPVCVCYMCYRLGCIKWLPSGGCRLLRHRLGPGMKGSGRGAAAERAGRPLGARGGAPA